MKYFENRFLKNIVYKNICLFQGALRIQDLSIRDSGIYTCIAGKSKADLNLIVKQRPGEFPSSEEIERQKANPLDDPNDSVDR